MQWLRQFWVIELLRYVFTRLRAEKLRSEEAVVTGIVKYNFKSLWISRRNFLRLASKDKTQKLNLRQLAEEFVKVNDTRIGFFGVF